MFLFKWFVITVLCLLLGCASGTAIFLGFIGAVIDSMIED